MSKTSTLSIVIIAKNEEKNISDTITSGKFADEVLVIDTGSTDKTINIAKKFGARIVETKGGSFNDWRNVGLKNALGKWIFYLDSDERITPNLQNELISIANNPTHFVAYAVPRRNFIFGKEFKFSNQYPDYQKRFLLKEKIKLWKGAVHEEPVFEGELGYLKNPLIHHKHDNLFDMVEKTNKWSAIEAKLLYDANHPPMAWWRFFRIMGTELWSRLILEKGYKDGPEGVIYAFYQMFSRFITYAKLWEMQLKKGQHP